MLVEGAPPLDPKMTAALLPFARASTSRVLDVSSDGKIVLALQNGDVVEQAANEAAVARITARDAVWAAFSPGGLLSDSDKNGDESFRLFRGETALSESSERQVDPVLDPTRTWLAWSQVAAGAHDFDLWLDDGRAPKLVFHGTGMWTALDVASDGKTLLARHYVSATTSSLHVIDVATGTARALTQAGTNVSAPLGRFGKHGEVFVVSDKGGDRLGLYAIDLAGQQPEKTILSPAYAEVMSMCVMPDGSLAYATNQDGSSRLDVYNPVSGRNDTMRRVPYAGVVSDLHCAKDAAVLAFTFSDSTHPRESVLYDVVAQTFTVVSDIDDAPDPDQLRMPTREFAQASDGGTVPLYIFTPAAKGPVPVVIDLHGGPEEHWDTRYYAFEQFLVKQGYAVVQPDVRGSSGYGRAFAAGDDGVKRKEVLLDVRAVVDWVNLRNQLYDPKRIVLMGTSYGGFLALAALAAMPEKFVGAIDMAGIPDLASFLAHTSAYRQDTRRAEYGDERDAKVKAALDALSPLRKAGSFRKPILVAHGAHDARVPPEDAARLVKEARAGGAEVWSLVAADEGHGFAKPGNRGVYEVVAAQFLAYVTRPKEK